MIDAGVPVDEQHPGGFHVVSHPVPCEFATPADVALEVIAEDAHFVAQGLDFGNAVEAEEFAPLPGGMVAELFHARDPSQGEVSEQQKDRLHGIEAFGQGEVTLRVAQQAEGEQRWQGTEHSSVGDVVGGLEGRLGFLQQTDRGGDTLQRASGAHPHGSFAIGHAARTLGGRGVRGRGVRA